MNIRYRLCLALLFASIGATGCSSATETNEALDTNESRLGECKLRCVDVCGHGTPPNPGPTNPTPCMRCELVCSDIALDTREESAAQ